MEDKIDEVYVEDFIELVKLYVGQLAIGIKSIPDLSRQDVVCIVDAAEMLAKEVVSRIAKYDE